VTQVREQLVARAAGPGGGELPAAPTVLVGRDTEAKRICELLCREDVRLLTLTGPGGVGKTRLGVRAAAMSREEFADGVAFVSLGALHDELLVANAIAAALGLAEAGDRAPRDRVIAYLGDRQTLLLVDGFEQLLGAAPLLAELLASCPQLTLLITSRAALELAGEHEFRVPPLASPPAPEDHPDPPALSTFPAALLFMQRAEAVDHDFQLTPPRARAVAEICRRLDGLPLAIELAAARVRLLPPEAMVARLDHRLELLTGGRRDAPRRQQTMRETVVWSYDLLAPAHQRLFRLLSVFAGGCTLESVEFIASELHDDGENILEALDSLLAQSMVVRLGGDGDARVGMLETLQEYAAEALETAGERADAERAHAVWCLDLARAAESALWGSARGEWLDRIELELPNLRAALRRLLDSGHHDEARDLATALERFWLGRGHLAEGRKWLEESVADDRGAPCDRSRALSVAATLASYGGEPTRARVLAARALQTARECGRQDAFALALCAVALAARYGGDFAEARDRYAEAIELLRELDLPTRLAEALTRCAAAALWQGDASGVIDSDSVARLSEEALELCRGAGDAEGWVYASMVNVWALALVGDPRFDTVVADVLESARAVGSPRHASRMVFLQGMSSLRRGEHVQGLAQLEEASAITSEFGDKGFQLLFCLPGLAHAELLAGRPDDAARLLEATDRACDGAGASIPPWMRADRGGGVDAMRAALADPRYDAARAHGATLSVKQALDLAYRADTTSEAGDDEELRTLTARELEVLGLLTRELTDAQIAQELVVSRRTVHAHLRSIFRKLDVGSRVAAARWAADHNLGSEAPA